MSSVSVMIFNPFNRIFKHSELINNLFNIGTLFFDFNSFFKWLLFKWPQTQTLESIPSRGPFPTSKRTFIKLHYLYANHQIKKRLRYRVGFDVRPLKKLVSRMTFSSAALVRGSTQNRRFYCLTKA